MVCQSQRSPQLNTLNVASNIHTQARPLSTVGTMNGSKTVARMKRAKRILRFSKTASHMPKTALRTVAVEGKNTVVPDRAPENLALKEMRKIAQANEVAPVCQPAYR